MKRVLLMAATALALAGCIKKSDSEFTCNYDACAVKAPEAEVNAVQAYLTQQNITATKHCSGVFYAIDSMGTGPAPTACSGISFRYKGMLTNGSVFDRSDNPTQPMALSQLLRGWMNVLPLIRQGGGMRIYIPPTLGYGKSDVPDRNGNVIIPANSVLIFEVKLDGVLQ